MRKHLFVGLLYASVAALCFQPPKVVAKESPPDPGVSIINEGTAVAFSGATSETPVSYAYLSPDAAMLPDAVLVTAKGVDEMSLPERKTKLFKPYLYAVRAVYPKRMFHIDPGLRGC